jgi:hypothetical protein
MRSVTIGPQSRNRENRPMRVALVVLALLAAAPAQAGVRVVPPFDPADYADRAAVGLLVPGAGPTVTREAALAALLRGKLEHGLLGGIAPGENLIELGAPGAPEILVSLPPPGRSDNDVRYPIALLGERGLLTSDSTRIDGLVSVTDIATGRLRVVENDDPAQALEELDARIERNSDWRLPLTIALAALLIALAFVRPRYALRALLVALAVNLWLSPLLAVAAGVAVLLLPLGWACAPSSSPTSSRWGSIPRRSRSRRSALPVRPLLRDQQPARDDAARSGAARRCAARRAGSSSPGSRSSRSAATASAPTAAASSCSRSPTSCSGCGCAASGRRGAWQDWSRRAPSRSRWRCSARRGDRWLEPRHGCGRRRPRRARGRHRRPDRALRPAHRGEPRRHGGRGGLARDPGRRRAAAAPKPVLDAFLVGIAVSLVVNDTPGDVLGMGAAIAIALSRYTPERRWLSSGSMRRAAALLALLAFSLGLAGCGGEEVVSPTPETIVGTVRLRPPPRRLRPSPSRRSRATLRTEPRSSPQPVAAAATRSRRPGPRATSAPTSTTLIPIPGSWSNGSPTARA